MDKILERSMPVPFSGCWIWLGAIDGAGYGHKGDGRRGRTIGAHRWAWKIVNGPIPRGMSVCHRCDVPLCVNPDHLFLGSQKDNLQDMRTKGRHHQRKGFCKHGHLINEKNGYVYRGFAYCRECNRIAAEKYRKGKKI
jgi:hypothetical protein